MLFDSEERLPQPACETGDIVVAAPQEVTDSAHPNQLIRFLPIVTAVATVVAMAAVYAARSSVMRNPVFLIFPVMMLVSALATALSSAGRHREEVDAQRADYFGYLAEKRADAVKTKGLQRESATWSHPDPDTLWTLVGGRRMWERTAEDVDFCQVRIGVGPVPLARRLIAPAVAPVHRLDPVSVAALERFIRMQSSVSNMPISVSLRGPAVVRIRGDTTQARELLRAMVCQLAVMHSPAEVAIAAVVSDRTRPEWEWLKWLPHNRHPNAADDVGPARMVYPSLAVAYDALEMPGRQVVVVVDSGERPCDTGDITMLTIEDSGDARLVVASSGKDVVAQTDRLSYDAALMCAQRMAGYRPARCEASPNGASWQDLVGIADVTSYSPSARGRGRSLRVPVGITADGSTVELDIKEAAANGMGPHGLCIGATGSGKSEFLRTVALGMIVGHSPEELNLVLVDFKGGATFSGLEPAPHVAAVITNLSDKTVLVSRMRDALMGELNRRQEALREAGNLDGITAYQRRRRTSPDLKPLPTLFVIVDEFSELLSQHPDFADVFVAVGRLGRSLGVHLLLASQRLDEGKLRGLESHLSYRVCLKTLSINESRMVLGSAAAYELSGAPGAAYLRVGTDTPVRFHTAFVSGPTETGIPTPRPTEPTVVLREFTTAPVGSVCLARDIETEPAECPTVLQAIVERLSGDGPRAHEVWLAPLAASPALRTVLLEAGPIRPLTAPIGIVDRPFDQRRTPLIVDVSGAAGNVAVVGAPQSGKSTALRTLIDALAVTHDPRMVQFYCLDFGGGSLDSVRDWPHVGSVAGRADPERLRRTIARLTAVVRSREALFREHAIESMAHYRRLSAAGDSVCDGFGDIFLIVDGWVALQRELEMAELSITALAAEGLSYGIHVVVAASRWQEIRPALRDQIGTRIELRLGDPADSELDRRRAQQVPEGSPGRGLSHDGLHMLIALPQDDKMLRRDAGWVAPPIPLLPRMIEQSRIIEQASGNELVIGIEETELLPFALDFTQQQHLLILGDSECGKTSTLRTLCHEVLRTTTSAESQIFVVDPRRSLLGVIDAQSEHLGCYLASADAVAELMPRVTERLRQRMPSPDVTPTQLRDSSWWTGPEIYVVVDDYDLLGGDAFAALVTMLPHSRDVGLHLIVARRMSGATRAMFEPLLAGLRDAGCTTLLMSGSPEEGLTIGPARPSPLPPGRGLLITRRGDPQLIQVGWTTPQ